MDACVIAVKITQLMQALERVPVRPLGNAMVVPFLNGIEHVDLLRSIWPRPPAGNGAENRVKVAPAAIGARVAPFNRDPSSAWT